MFRTPLQEAWRACKDKNCKECGSPLHVEQWNREGALFMLRCRREGCRLQYSPQGTYTREPTPISPLAEFNEKPEKKYRKSPTKL